jgi:hypothetical protein
MGASRVLSVQLHTLGWALALVGLAFMISCGEFDDAPELPAEPPRYDDRSQNVTPRTWLVWYQGMSLAHLAPRPLVPQAVKAAAAQHPASQLPWTCLPQYDTACQEGKLHWVDSCGLVGATAVDCAAGCDDTGCLGCEEACKTAQCGSDGCGGQCGFCEDQAACYQNGCHPAPHFVWTYTAGKDGLDAGWTVAASSQGGLFVAGYTFSPDLQLGGQAVGASGASDGLLARFHPDGSVAWVRGLGGESFDKNVAVVWSDLDQVCTTGWFKSATIDMGGGPLLNAGGASDNDDIFIGCYSPEGDHVWSASLGGFGGDYPESMAASPDGNLLLTGRSGGFGMKVGDEVLGPGILLARLNNNGAPEWARIYNGPGTGVNVGRFVATGQDETAVVAGEFATDWVEMGDFQIESHGSSDAFVTKVAANGQVIWARGFGGLDADAALTCQADLDGNVLAAGHLHSDAAQVGNGVILHGPGAFVVKFDADGTPLWAQSLGQSKSDAGRSLLVDDNGTILLAMDFADQVEICGETFVSAGETDILLVRLGADGTCRWANSYGGAGIETGNSLAISAKGTAFMTGAFASESLWVGGSEWNSQGGKDLFVTAFVP